MCRMLQCDTSCTQQSLLLQDETWNTKFGKDKLGFIAMWGAICWRQNHIYFEGNIDRVKFFFTLMSV